MKKMVSLVCMLALLLGALGTTAFAAPQDDILAAVDANIPSGILQYYRTMGINILTQIDVTDAQAQEVSALIKQAGALLQEGTQSAHEYRATQRERLLELFAQICAVLHLSYTTSTKPSGLHAGDVVIHLYYNGTPIGELDGDFIKQTDVPTRTGDSVGMWTAIGITLFVACAASVVVAYRKSRVPFA